MNIPTLRVLSVLALAVSLAACNKPVADGDVAAPVPADSTTPAAEAAPAPPAEPVAGAAGLLKASAGTASCDTGSDIRFDWDVSTRPEVSTAEVWVGEGPEAKLFTAGGAQGGESTGPWVKPATVFILRDKATGSELDRIVIAGPACSG